MAANPVLGKLLGRGFEVASWIPFLLILSALGGASLTREMFDYPDWVLSAVDFYRHYAYPLAEEYLGDPEPWVVDAGLVGLGIFSLVARSMFSFLVSLLAFAAFAAFFGFGTNALF